MNNNVAVQQLLQLMMSKYLLLKQSILLCFSSTFCTLWLCNKIHCDVHDHLSSGSMCFFCVLVSSFGYGFCDVLMFPSSCFRYLFCHDLMHQMKQYNRPHAASSTRQVYFCVFNAAFERTNAPLSIWQQNRIKESFGERVCQTLFCEVLINKLTNQHPRGY